MRVVQPISYYGGKQRLAKRIIALIPDHNLYAEVFAGGAAIFFAKEPSALEVINDTNGELINFYKVLKTQYKKLAKEIQSTLHSRELHNEARVVYANPNLFNEVKRAWAVWVLANQSFGSMLGDVWRCDYKDNSCSKSLRNKRQNFTKKFAERLELAQIECRDALQVIASRDQKEAFFYCDPPYFNSNMGHYGGYTEKDFENLLELLSKIKGKFLLSSYPSDILMKYTKKFKWHTQKMEMSVSINGRSNGKRKTEMLTANYEI